MPTRTWTTVEDLRPHLDPIVAELGRFPTGRELIQRDCGFLIDATQKFGGPRKVSEVLGYRYKGRQSWSSIETVRLHLDPIVAELGRMPKQRELESRDRRDLINAIHKFGGYPFVAQQLGYSFVLRQSWSSVNDLRPHLDPLVDSLGRMPTQTELKELGRGDLLNQIPKFGGYGGVADSLGYPYRRFNSWKTVEDLRPHLDPIVAELGHMPSQRDLVARGRTDIRSALPKFGGLTEVAKKLGYPHSPPESWKDVDQLRPYLDPIVQELGRMPGPGGLTSRGLDRLNHAIYRFGGFSAVAEALRYPFRQRQVWKTVEDLRPHLEPIVGNLGRMPTTPELLALKRSDLIGAIQKFDGNATVARALGYQYEGPKSWESVEDLRPYLDPLVAEFGRLPTVADLSARDSMFLNDAMHKFGGKHAVALALGYPYKSWRRWQAVEELRPYLDPVVRELGHMPTFNELKDRDLPQLSVAIGKKFGGIAGVAESLGYPYKVPKNWVALEDFRRELAQIVAELGRMPTKRELLARGRHDITNAFQRFGGQKVVAEALGYPYEVRRRTWNTIEDLRPHLDPFVAELGRMPSASELTIRRRIALTGVIRKFGGPASVAEALGYRYDPPRSWTTVEDLRVELDPYVGRLGRMPKKGELLTDGRFDLRGAINKFGGFAIVAEALGYPFEFAPAIERRERVRQLESALVELHVSQMLAAGQIMLILRHAGLLSVARVADMFRRLPLANVSSTEASDLDVYLSSARESHREEDMPGCSDLPDFSSWVVSESHALAPGIVIDGSRAVDEQGEASNQNDICGPNPSKVGSARDRAAEIKELRGWSHLGNLIDPAPALVQLSVTRLKTAFYGFANDVRGSLEAPATPATLKEIERLEDQLRKSAFGEYGDLIDNDLVREATETYVADLASALLLPRQEAEYIPRLYQLDGGRFIADRVSSDQRPYGLLFDQPGMGKTLTTLWGLAAAGAERVVIVAPLTVKREVWTIEQIRQAFPGLEEHCFAAGLDAALALPPDGPAIAVLHYEELRRHDEIRILASPQSNGSPPFDAIVLDEAHEVKERLSTYFRGPTRTGAWLLREGGRACIGLTATPVVNELFEPVSLLHLVQGRRDSDAGRRLQSRRLRDRVDVMEYLLADSLRRLKPDVLFEIPTREIRIHEVVPDASLLARIGTFLGRSRRVVSAELAEYRRLMLEAKLDWIAGIVTGNVTAVTSDGVPDPKTLVLCYNVEGVSRSVHERLAAELGADRVLHVDGTTSEAMRKEAFHRFREPADAETGIVALVGSVGTVGVGVTLFNAEEPVTPHRVVFADLPFTWAEFEQGVDRLHRVGQRFPVRVEVPVVAFGDELIRADGEHLKSFDQGVWEWIRRKQRLADQVLDAAFDVSEYKDSQIRKAIASALKAVEESGGAVIAPVPPAESAAAEHRREVGRLRGMPRKRAAKRFEDPSASERFLAVNDNSPSARLAQRLARERLSRWLDSHSVVVDLGCGSNPLRDLPCKQVIGIDRHGVNGGLVGDSADTGLPVGGADFVVMNLSMWGTPEDRLAYLQEAKRLLRPIGKLVIIEPTHTFGGTEHWRTAAERFALVLERLGMRLAEVREYTVDEGTSLVAFVIDNCSAPPAANISAHDCVWHD